MKKLQFLSFVLTAAVVAFLFSCGAVPDDSAETVEATPGPEYLAYFGTYTRGESDGIYVYRFDASTGVFSEIGLAAEIPNPTFLAVHPNNRNLYAVVEDFSGDSVVRAYMIDRATGELQLLNEVSSKGSAPCHGNVDETGKMLVIANYGSGSTASFPIHPDGSLGQAASFIQHTGSSVDPKRQAGPHAHSANFSLDNRIVVVADLGTDQLLLFRAHPDTATLEPNDPPFAKVAPGGGPRHFTFHPSGRFGYTNNEMGNSVTAFEYDAERGALAEIQTISTLPEDFTGVNHTAEILTDQTGRFLYVSNRGHNSVAVFSIDAATGKLTAVERVSTQGETPRNFALDPTGNFLIAQNQDTNNVVVFRIGPATGKLTPTGQTLTIPMPVCLRFVPLENHGKSN